MSTTHPTSKRAPLRIAHPLFLAGAFTALSLLATGADAQGLHQSSAVWTEDTAGFSLQELARAPTVAGVSVGGTMGPGDIDIAGTPVTAIDDALVIGSLNDNGTPAWIRTDVVGDPAATSLRALRRRNDGSTVMVGDLNGVTTFGGGWPGDPAGGVTLSASAQRNAWLVVYHADGHVIGGKGFGGGGSSSYGVWDVAVTKGGVDAFYLVGTMDDAFYYGGQQRMPAQGDGAYITRINPNGSFGWARSAIGGVDITTFQPLFASSLLGGGVVVAGTGEGIVDFDDGNGGVVTVDLDTHGQLFLVKYFANGTLAWVTSTETPSAFNEFELLALSTAEDRSTYVLGRAGFGNTVFGSGEAGEVTFNNPYGTIGEYVLAHYHPNGTFDWVMRVKDHDNNATAVQFNMASWAVADGVTITGYFSGGGTTHRFCPEDLTPYDATGWDARDTYVLRVDNTGTCQWFSMIPGDGDQNPVGIAHNHVTGEIIVAGQNDGADVTFGPGEAGEETFVTPADFAYVNVLSP